MSLHQMMQSVCTAADFQEPLPECRINGNQLEMNIPSCPNPIESGRLAIIQAGQILERLSRQARQTGDLFQVRIFPSLDCPQLIALATLHRSRNGALSSGFMAEMADSGEPLPVLLQMAAARCGLTFQPLPEGLQRP